MGQVDAQAAGAYVRASASAEARRFLVELLADALGELRVVCGGRARDGEGVRAFEGQDQHRWSGSKVSGYHTFASRVFESEMRTYSSTADRQGSR